MKNTVKTQTGRTAALRCTAARYAALRCTAARSAAVLIALLMSMPFFASCGVPGGADGTSEQSAGTEAPVTMPADPGEPVLPSGGEAVIFEGGKTIFPLIRRDVAGTGVISLYSQIIRAAGGGTGKVSAYKGGTDWVKEGTDMTGVPELLLGYTDRPESLAVMRAIGLDGCAAGFVGNKIVIAAHTEDKLREAVDRFCSEMLRVEEKDGVLRAVVSGSFADIGGGGGFLSDSGSSAADFRIVYREGSAECAAAASEMRRSMIQAYGVKPEAVSDSTPPSGKEIVIGDTNRAVSAKYRQTVAPGSYIAAASEGSLVIIGDSDTMTKLAVSDFISKQIPVGLSYALTLKEDFYMDGGQFAFRDPPERADGTDIRVMSFNLLCELWDAKVPVDGRDRSAVSAMYLYSPDVIGLQEMSDKWYAALDRIWQGRYLFTDRKNAKGQTNFSTLAYDPSRVKLLDHGTKVYSAGNDPRLRLATWGYFETVGGGKRFIAMSTHWDLGKNAAWQTLHSNEMAALALELKAKYGCPVVTTGDYNVNEDSTQYANFLEKTGFADAKFSAKVVNRACKTTHSLGSPVSDVQANAIDHIFGSPDLEFLFFNVLTDRIMIDTSDHCAIYADVKLGK